MAVRFCEPIHILNYVYTRQKDTICRHRRHGHERACGVLSRVRSNSERKRRKTSEETRRLQSLGIPVTIGADAQKAEGADLVVFSSAIAASHPELKRAREKGIKTIERHEFLALIAGMFSCVVAIGGTHGKTSISAMLTHILLKSGTRFVAMIGGESVEFANYVNNTSATCVGELKNCIFVCEACEYKRNLLSLAPSVAAVTNAECDHPDCYKSQKDVDDVFCKFLAKAQCKIVSEKYEFLLQENEKRVGESRNEKCGNFCVEIFSDDKIERLYADIKKIKRKLFWRQSRRDYKAERRRRVQLSKRDFCACSVKVVWHRFAICNRCAFNFQRCEKAV